MQDAAQRLGYLIDQFMAQVKLIDEGQMTEHLPDKWSKKQILGHLCDSAANNLHRFIKAQFEDQPFVIIPYAQNNWVTVQNYQNTSVDEIISYWLNLNKHLVRVIANIPVEKLDNLCQTDSKTLTLAELVLDYLRHLEHHLKQIFNRTEL